MYNSHFTLIQFTFITPTRDLIISILQTELCWNLKIRPLGSISSTTPMGPCLALDNICMLTQHSYPINECLILLSPQASWCLHQINYEFFCHLFFKKPCGPTLDLFSQARNTPSGYVCMCACVCVPREISK